MSPVWRTEQVVEEEMAAHSSFSPGESPRTEGPGRLQSMGSQRVGHKLAITSVFSPGESPRTEGPGRLQSMGSQRVGHKLAITSVFLPGESHERRSSADYSPWGRREVDTTE